VRLHARFDIVAVQVAFEPLDGHFITTFVLCANIRNAATPVGGRLIILVNGYIGTVGLPG
jgi:hypothetical protein